MNEIFTFYCSKISNFLLFQSWCHFTDEPLYHSTADAVLFHANNFKLDTSPRRPGQIYVWFDQESSVHEVIDIPPGKFWSILKNTFTFYIT